MFRTTGRGSSPRRSVGSRGSLAGLPIGGGVLLGCGRQGDRVGDLTGVPRQLRERVRYRSDALALQRDPKLLDRPIELRPQLARARTTALVLDLVREPDV